MKIRSLKLVFLAAVAVGSAYGGPITFTMTATVSGTLGTTSFTDALLTVTSIADTSDVTVIGGASPDLVYAVTALDSTVSIAGVTPSGSPATFTGATYWEDPNGSGDIIFGDASGGAGFGCDPGVGCPILGFVNFFTGPPYLTYYELDSSIGPVSGNDFPVAVFDAFENIPTSDGLLSIPQSLNSAESNNTVTEDFMETFVANTPEPSSLFLAIMPLASYWLLRRRKI